MSKNHHVDVGIDVDDVLADFSKRYLEIAKSVVPRPLSVVCKHWDMGTALGLQEDEQRKVTSIMKSPGQCFDLDPLPGAIEAVQRIASIANRVYFVTAPWRGATTWTHEREAWLVRHFGRLGRNTISTTHKHMVAVHVLVDDKTTLLDRWIAEGYPRQAAICWGRPCNEGWGTDIPRCFRAEDWGTVEGLITELEEQYAKSTPAWR